MSLHCYFKISVDLHLVLASLLGGHWQQKDRGGDRLRGFLLRRWWKATKPTGIAGPLFLAKKCLAWGKLATDQFFMDVKTRQRSVTLKGVVNCRILDLAYAKICSKANTAFLRNFAPAKISRYTVSHQRGTHPLLK